MDRRISVGLGTALAVIIADQASKWWIMERVMRPEGIDGTPFYSPIRVNLAPVFDLVMAWNRGVSFGIGNNDGPWNALILSALALAIVAFMLVWLKNTHATLLQIGLGGIIGGALGNVIDRVRFGAVADFLYFHVGDFHWPAFNLADSAITVGAVILVLDALFGARVSTKNEGHD
jgi:signal peptidase II